ncbi:MAG: AI-2E family transporter [Treponema sp.]|nr:AI-2E family transporter [Treponema sp.]
MKITSPVILPFTIALLLAFITYPIIKWLDKLHLPRIVSILLVILIIVTGLYGFGMVLITAGRTVIAQRSNIENRLLEIYAWTANIFDFSYNEDLSLFENLWAQLGVRTWLRTFTFSFSNFFFQFLRNAFLVVLFMAFFLAEASFFKEKLVVAFESRSDRIRMIAADLMNKVTRYLTAKFFISLGNGLIFAIIFRLIGLDFALIWGLLAFILNFIPTLGSIVAGIIISLYALVQFWPEPAPIIMVIAVILGGNVITGNILDPKIIGDNVGLSPLMVLASLLIWGYIWGFAGMVVAVPMMVTVKIVCENISILEPISILMGSRKAVQAKKADLEKAEV